MVQKGVLKGRKAGVSGGFFERAVAEAVSFSVTGGATSVVRIDRSCHVVQLTTRTIGSSTVARDAGGRFVREGSLAQREDVLAVGRTVLISL